MIQEFSRIKRISGKLNLPGDKSISHRSVMFAAMAKGKSEIYNCLQSQDVLSTIAAFQKMGCSIEITEKKIIINGRGKNGLIKPTEELYLGNSGTTTRLIAGILSAQKFPVILTGDPSLSNRPMKRIIDPLIKMGAKINSENGLLPIEILPVTLLKPMEYELPIASAQIKSCILLAGLFLEDETIVVEKKQSRNHTEKMLDLKIIEENEKRKIYSSIRNYPIAQKYSVPSDISTASFLIVLTLLLKDSKLELPGVSLNKTRIGVISILKKMGANIEFGNVEIINGEKRGDIIIRSSNLTNIDIPDEIIPNIIDEIPILAIAGLFAEGNFNIRNASELRHKESDRIKSVCENFKLLGIYLTEFNDGFELSGRHNINKVVFQSYNDHRIAMAFSILSLLLDQGGSVNNFECVDVSNPEFVNQLKSIYS